jgi:hypothetical protein
MCGCRAKLVLQSTGTHHNVAKSYLLCMCGCRAKLVLQSTGTHHDVAKSFYKLRVQVVSVKVNRAHWYNTHNKTNYWRHYFIR